MNVHALVLSPPCYCVHPAHAIYMIVLGLYLFWVDVLYAIVCKLTILTKWTYQTYKSYQMPTSLFLYEGQDAWIPATGIHPASVVPAYLPAFPVSPVYLPVCLSEWCAGPTCPSSMLSTYIPLVPTPGQGATRAPVQHQWQHQVRCVVCSFAAQRRLTVEGRRL